MAARDFLLRILATGRAVVPRLTGNTAFTLNQRLELTGRTFNLNGRVRRAVVIFSALEFGWSGGRDPFAWWTEETARTNPSWLAASGRVAIGPAWAGLAEAAVLSPKLWVDCADWAGSGRLGALSAEEPFGTAAVARVVLMWLRCFAHGTAFAVEACIAQNGGSRDGFFRTRLALRTIQAAALGVLSFERPESAWWTRLDIDSVGTEIARRARDWCSHALIRAHVACCAIFAGASPKQVVVSAISTRLLFFCASYAEKARLADVTHALEGGFGSDRIASAHEAWVALR